MAFNSPAVEVFATGDADNPFLCQRDDQRSLALTGNQIVEKSDWKESSQSFMVLAQLVKPSALTSEQRNPVTHVSAVGDNSACM